MGINYFLVILETLSLILTLFFYFWLRRVKYSNPNKVMINIIEDIFNIVILGVSAWESLHRSDVWISGWVIIFLSIYNNNNFIIKK